MKASASPRHSKIITRQDYGRSHYGLVSSVELNAHCGDIHYCSFLSGNTGGVVCPKLPRVLKGILDVILTLPLVLPPTVVGYLLLRVLGPRHTIGAWVLADLNLRLVMTWWSAIFATIIVIFPLMYRTARGAFKSFDETLAYSGQTLGMSNTRIFWRIRMPCCRQGILAGTVLAFARALGEYGATSIVAGYARKNSHHLHDRIPAVENKR